MTEQRKITVSPDGRQKEQSAPGLVLLILAGWAVVALIAVGAVLLTRG